MARRGAEAEDLAVAYLQGKGMVLKARNYACRLGEIDLILQEGATIVFVEVRHRRHRGFGGAAESITAGKRAKLIATARYYLSRQRSLPPCRFDAVLLDGAGRIEWIRDAFGE